MATFISFAQNFEDILLWRALKGVEQGNYIDVGAQDPIVDSVSKAFADAGWRGAHIEPLAEYAAALRAEHPGDVVIEAAVAAESGELTLYALAHSGLSTANQAVALHHLEHSGHETIEITVPSITMDEVFAAAGFEVVHWLKIDVEGFEGEVLKGWRESAVRPWIVVVEATFPTTAEPLYEQWEGDILEKGYDLVYWDGLNRFYLHASHRELAERFAVPPNVFDDFQLSGTASSMTARLAWRHEQEVQLLREEKLQVQSERDEARSELLEVGQSATQAGLAEVEQRIGQKLAEMAGEIVSLNAKVENDSKMLGSGVAGMVAALATMTKRYDEERAELRSSLTEVFHRIDLVVEKNSADFLKINSQRAELFDELKSRIGDQDSQLRACSELVIDMLAGQDAHARSVQEQFASLVDRMEIRDGDVESRLASVMNEFHSSLTEMDVVAQERCRLGLRLFGKYLDEVQQIPFWRGRRRQAAVRSFADELASGLEGIIISRKRVND